MNLGLTYSARCVFILARYLGIPLPYEIVQKLHTVRIRPSASQSLLSHDSSVSIASSSPIALVSLPSTVSSSSSFFHVVSSDTSSSFAKLDGIRGVVMLLINIHTIIHQLILRLFPSISFPILPQLIFQPVYLLALACSQHSSLFSSLRQHIEKVGDHGHGLDEEDIFVYLQKWMHSSQQFTSARSTSISNSSQHDRNGPSEPLETWDLVEVPLPPTPHQLIQEEQLRSLKRNA